MKTYTREEWLVRAAGDPAYYGAGDALWRSRVAACADLAGRVPGDRCLEVGPYLTPLVPGCDILDKRDWGVAGHRLIRHDASCTPWPLPDRAYDLAIACAVWEHLAPDKTHACHAAAWREIMRVADHCVWLVPFRWTRHATAYHNGIDLDLIAAWTCGCSPLEARVVGARPGWQCYSALYDLRPFRAQAARSCLSLPRQPPTADGGVTSG